MSARLVAGRHYGLYLVRGGSADAARATEPADAVRDGGPVAWFSFPGANSDGFDHLRVLARNRFAFEDLPGGGDEDFNDLLVEIRPPVTNGGSNPSPVLTNAPPTISAVAAQHTTTGAATGPIAFRVDDHETPPARLRVRASSSNPALVPDDGIVFGGSGADRTVALAPVAGVTGTARVTLWVTDEGGLTASTEFELSVTPPDAAPAFRSVPAGTAAVGRLYAYAARAEGFSALKYALVSGPTGAQFDPVAGYLGWLPTAADIGTQQVVLEATDDQGRTARQSFTVAVSATGEVRGTVTAGAPLPSALAVYLDANANGRRDAGERAVPVDANGNYVLTGLEAGSYAVAVDLPVGWEITDPPAGLRTVAVTGGAVTNGVNFTIRAHSGNHDPVITSTPPTLVPGTVYTYPVEATDPDGDPLSYSLVEGPAGMAVDPVTGVLTWPAPSEATTFQGRAAWEASAGGAAATTALHFDGPTATNERAVNDPRIDPSYLSQGVRFLPFTGTNVYPYILRNQQHQIPDPARDGLLANNSSPNPVSDLLGRAIRFEFTVPTYAVGVVTNRHPFDNPTGDGGYMRVYDAGGSLLAQVDVEPGVFAGVSTSVPIGRVEVVNTFGSDIKFGISELALGTKAPAYPVRVRVGDGRNGATEQAFVVAPTASPNLIVNGGFETGPDPLPTDLGYRIYGAGSTAIPGWTVTRDTIDYEGTHWTELDGTRSIDLAGTPGAGAIAQTIPTVPGQTYRVAFDLGGNMYGGPAVKEMRVSAAGQSADFRFDVTNSTTAVMNWRRVEWTFVADGPTATLEFASLGPAGGSFGAVIDEVAVYAPAAPAAGPRFTSQPLTGATVGHPYRYAPTVAAPAGPVRFDLVGAPAGMSVDPATGALFWEPAPDQAGPSDVVLRVWDAVERSTTQAFRIVVHTAADNRAPRITSTAPDVARVAAEYRYAVAASDPDGDALVFALTEAPAGMTIDPTTGAVTWTPRADQVGSARVTVTATDPSLATATQTFTVTVPDPAARPVVTITSPTNGALVGLPVEVTGTVASPGGQVDFYKVFYARADRVDPSQPEWDAVAGRLTDPDYVLIGEGRGPIANGRLAAFDPTVLTDDEYVLVVAAFDLNGQGWVEPVRVSVTGGPKIGAFTLAVTDLEIPLAGIPITVTRVYDSREAGEEGDFGFGWRLGIADARIRETVPQTGDGFFATGAAFRVGTRVYLTNAEGKREGFTFQPVPTPAFFTAAFKPVFVPDPGVTDTLTVDDLTLIQKADGTFAAYLVGFPYNPDTYRLTSKDGRTYTYDQAGGLRTVTDRTGTTLTFTRDGITSSTGVAVRFLRDTWGRITEVIDPDGKSIRYGYNGAGDLVTVTDRTNQVTTNVYRTDRPHYLGEVYDPLQHRAVKTEFDPSGRLVATTDALGNRSVQAYDPDHFTETVADALGNVTTLVYDTRGNVVRETDPLGRTTLREYDAADNEITTTDPLGHVTRRTFDARRNVLSETDARGGTTRYTFNTFDKVTSATDALGRVTTYRYDAKGNPLGTVDALGYATARTNDDQGRPVTETDANGNVTSYAYTDESVAGPTRVTHADGTFRTIAYSALGLPALITDERGAKLKLAYDASGRLLSVLAPDTGLTEYRYTGDLLTSQIDPLGGVTLYAYDAANQLVAKTDAIKGVTRYGYDKAGRLVTTTDPMNHTTTTAYRADGQVESVTDAAGGITRYEYDAAGNRTAEIDALDRRRNYIYDELNRLVRKDDCPCPDEIYAYDAVGNLVSRTDKNGHITRYEFDELNRLVTETDALNGVTRYQYDANGNQTAVTDANGHATQSTYDSRNRLTRRTDPAGFSVTFGYDGAGNQVSTTDQLGFITRFDYDGLGRLVRTENPEHGVTSNKYDLAGDLVSTTDPLGRETHYTFDLLRRLVKVTDAASGIVTYEYDSAGNRTALTDPVGNRTTFGFDELNRQVRETDPLGHSINTRFDAVGNRIEVVDRDGRKRTFIYDELDRLTDETWWDGATAIRTIHSDYDAVGNLMRISDPDSTYQFSYDALDRQITVDNAGTPNLPHLILTNRYDAVGNRIEVRDNTGVTVDSTYDARDLLTSRRWSGGGVSDARIDFGYDARTERTSVARYSDLAGSQLVSHSSLSYDKLGRVSEIDHFGANGTAVSAYGYSYDAASQLARELRNGTVIDYRYDAIGQLLGADRATGPDESYSYDAAGNRTGSGYQTGPANRLLSDGTFNYSYDFEGNLVRKTEITTGAFTEYTYDYRNRLVGVTERDTVGSITTEVHYTYDALDRRIATTVNGVSTLTVHDGNATWADYNTIGDVSAHYLLGDRIDEMLARFRPREETVWYLTDKIGTVRELFSDTGAVLGRIDYGSFGDIISQTSTTYGDRFTFTGRELDNETGSYYYRARFYNPTNGRFNTEDSIRLLGNSINFYQYTGNHPINSTDPSGNTEAIEYSLTTNLVIGAAVGGLFGILVGAGHKAIDKPADEWTKDDYIDIATSGILGAFLGATFGVASAAAAAGSTLAQATIAFLEGLATASFGYGIYTTTVNYQDDPNRLVEHLILDIAVAGFTILSVRWSKTSILRDLIQDESGSAPRPRGDLPARGTPNSTAAKDDGKGNRQTREYGPDGRATKDIDFGHDHGAGDPHAHDWDWTQMKPRQPGRPLKPGE
ncbi:choice-of-anchor C family protein [Gemmata sp. SH-PL17]|uniref:choice-of-anchor C family protein n=1 Tax=Gemmata sp. SH-PL17 TaxID=1630693 RepID=UPI001EF5819B|nr:choice-of-anchor C family protein [Gemmata sp. SH-PL17]